MVIGPDSVGFGLIGASSIAWRSMVQAIRRQAPEDSVDLIAPAWVVAVCSQRESRARSFAEAHKIPHTYTVVEEMLARREIRSVYVSTHPSRQGKMVKAALLAGKHVLCETPLALTLDEADNLCQMAANRGLVLAVNLIFRAQPAVESMRRLLEDGAIGDLLGARVNNTAMLDPESRGWRLHSPDGGVLLDRTIHDIDILHYLVRDRVTQVFASSTPRLLNSDRQDAVEEEMLAQVYFAESGITVQLHDSFNLPHVPATIEIYGSRGTLTVQDWTDMEGYGQLTLYRSRRRQIQPTVEMQPAIESVRRFLSAIGGDGPPLATGEDARESLQVILALHASTRRNHLVRLDASQGRSIR